MMTKRKTKTQTKASAVRKLREAKSSTHVKAKPKAKKPAPLKSFAQLPAPPRADKLRSDTIALNLLKWDTAELESAKVQSIASSYRETGTQISRITIRPAGKRYRVVAGRHRCEAAKVVGWTELKYELLPYLTEADKLNADLIEIDENLCRKNLTPAMEAALTTRRKAIYEKLHPTTAHGGDRKSSRQVGNLFSPEEGAADGEDATRFTEATARTAGRSERSVQRAASRGEAIGADNLARIAHTSLDKGEELDALAKLDLKERKDVIERAAAGEKVSAKTELKKQTRANKEQTLGGLQLALPDKKYGVILADPEWRFEPWSRETGMSRAADNHYPTSCTEVIAARDVPSIAADDCVLFLCATAPMLPHALVVMSAWGFDYVSNYVLEKDRIITGYWNRNKHEHLLIGTRGKIMCPSPGTQWDSIIPAPVGKHSKKPVKITDMIKEYFPTLPKIELNRIGPPLEGWDAWGNQAAPAETTAEPQQPMTELEALEAVDNELPLTGVSLATLKGQNLVRGSVKLRLTKAGIARLGELRRAANPETNIPKNIPTSKKRKSKQLDLEDLVGAPQQPVTVDCRVCGTGNGLCAECLPAESHVVTMTTDPENGWEVGTCSCGQSYTFPRSEHSNMDEAIKLHWQVVVAAAKKEQPVPAEAVAA